MGLSEEDRVKILEGIAADESLKPTMRLRAIEELGLIESRRRIAEGKQATVAEDDAPYLYADLWEIEEARIRRAKARGISPSGSKPRSSARRARKQGG